MNDASELSLENLELRLLLEAVHGVTGIDFRGYAPASLKRRVLSRVQAEQLPSISALQDRALHNADCMHRLVTAITVHYTALFRDPTFWSAFRERVVPLLARVPRAVASSWGRRSGLRVDGQQRSPRR